MPVNAYWIAMVEMVWHGFHFSATSIPMNVIFIVFTLALVNAGVHRFFPSYALTQAELLVIYIMMATTTSVIAHDNMVSLMGPLTHAFWFASPENEWKQLIHPHLPKWLVMEHTEMARPFYEGGANFFTDGYLRYWIAPILSWTAIATLIFFLVAFLNVFIRRQWIEHERMPYPIAQLPLDMTAPGMSFFQNRAMWWGFGIAATIEIVNGLNFLYPSVPLIPIREPTADLALWLNNEPWDAIGTTYFHLRLFMIGLCFLLPIDLSFSMAFFYWVRKAQFIGGRAAGLYTIPYYPFLPNQAVGAFLAIIAMAIWAGAETFQGNSEAGSRHEYVSRRFGRAGALPIRCHWHRGLSSPPLRDFQSSGNVVLGVPTLFWLIHDNCSGGHPYSCRTWSARAQYGRRQSTDNPNVGGWRNSFR